jgi:hypothetical protein
MNWLTRLHRLYHVRPFRMLDTAKNLEVTLLLYCMRVGAFIFCKKMAGGSLFGLGKDRIVRLARRSFVKSWRPRFPSVAPPSSPKIDVGTSTLSPLVGIVYLCQSKFDAPACNVDTRPSKARRANVRHKCRGECWALRNRDRPFIAKAPRREPEPRLFLRSPNCARRPVKGRGRDRESKDPDR